MLLFSLFYYSLAPILWRYIFHANGGYDGTNESKMDDR